MSAVKRKPGRPRAPNARNAAERMRLSREHKRKAGYRIVQSWVSSKPLTYSDHQRLDARSLALHSLVARKLLSNPALIEEARANLGRWKSRHPPPLPSYFDEWARVLKGTAQQIAGFLASMDEDATRLRQSSPFSNALTAEERSKIYEAFR
jgi:hypothetical protein